MPTKSPQHTRHTGPTSTTQEVPAVRHIRWPEARVESSRDRTRTYNLPINRRSVPRGAICRLQITVSPLDLHKCSSRADRATLAGVPPCAGECRFVCGKPVGKCRRGPDLWVFCGASGRAAQPLDDGSKSRRCQRDLGSLGETAPGTPASYAPTSSWTTWSS